MAYIISPGYETLFPRTLGELGLSGFSEGKSYPISVIAVFPMKTSGFDV